jgi:hypothetical protein
MLVLGTILDFVILAALAVGVLVWRSLSSGFEQAAKAQAGEVIKEINRKAVLDRELEKRRGTERQELRFISYGRLWAEMRPLALYDDSRIDQKTTGEMSKKLSNWYFSETGGLMLTKHNRDLYFALQDLVSIVGRGDYWETERTDETKTRFENLLRRNHLTPALKLAKYLQDAKTEDWPHGDLEEMAAAWRSDVGKLASDWAEIDGNDRFAVLQQVSSALRTGLANDVESRLR